MKFWLLPCVLILATSCSHSASKTNSAAPKPVAEGAPTMDKGEKVVKAKITSKTAGADHAACKHGDDERTLEVVTKGDGCAVEYTKQKEKREIASAEHETDHCKQVVAKVRGHLEAAGFTCN